MALRRKPLQAPMPTPDIPVDMGSSRHDHDNDPIVDNDFEHAIREDIADEDFQLIIKTIPLLTPAQLSLLQKELPLRPAEKTLQEHDRFSLKDEVNSQIAIISQLRKELFFPDGSKRADTLPEEVTNFLTTGLRLLQLLQRFEESLLTDEDLRKIVSAINNAAEEMPEGDDSASEFVALLKAELQPEGLL